MKVSVSHAHTRPHAPARRPQHACAQPLRTQRRRQIVSVPLPDHDHECVCVCEKGRGGGGGAAQPITRADHHAFQRRRGATAALPHQHPRTTQHTTRRTHAPPWQPPPLLAVVPPAPTTPHTQNTAERDTQQHTTAPQLLAPAVEATNFARPTRPLLPVKHTLRARGHTLPVQRPRLADDQRLQRRRHRPLASSQLPGHGGGGSGGRGWSMGNSR